MKCDRCNKDCIDLKYEWEIEKPEIFYHLIDLKMNRLLRVCLECRNKDNSNEN
jgi:hypothetical protein